MVKAASIHIAMAEVILTPLALSQAFQTQMITELMFMQ
jgi:hypothetical protein